MPHYSDKTCGTCQHWHPQDGKPTGECRAIPPAAHLTQATSILLPGGAAAPNTFNITVIYPPLPRDFKACCQYEEAPPAE